MKEYFEMNIAPLNNTLCRMLNVTHIEIKQESNEVTIPVTISYTSHSGNHVTRKAGHKSFYEALGLRI